MSAFRHYSSRARPYKLSAGNSTAPLALALVADLVELGAFGASIIGAGTGAYSMMWRRNNSQPD
jgi:hypothetical protein